MESKIIIFDFDGTLVDSFEYAISAFNNISQKYNLQDISISYVFQASAKVPG